MTTGVYDWLALRLGVSVASLQALQVGYAPRVVFTGKGTKPAFTSYDGWFTTPMRDGSAKITGLSLRGLNDKKLVWPGSKAGCMFVVNQLHRHGEHGYSSGAHNWVRVADAGVNCPICDKPDGCVVSEENPVDPKAVICIREQSPKKLKLGWLHIRKDTGILASASPISGGETDEPIVVVEGMSDACAAFDLGLPSIGRPNADGGMEVLVDLVRSRTVIIVGENDRKPDGKWPGQIGASLALKTCNKSTAKARIVYPPEHIKDLRAWRVNAGLTKDLLLSTTAEKGEETIANDVIQDDRPLTIVQGFIRDIYTRGSTTILKSWEGGWYVYKEGEGRYAPVKDQEIISAFFRWSQPKMLITQGPKGDKVGPLKASASMWTNIGMAALGDSYIVGELPMWMNGKTGTEPKNLLVFNNGILDVAALLEGEEGYLMPLTPDLFTTNALPFPFDPTATCPQWEAFIESSLGDDPEKIALLQEWMGLCMTPDASYERMLFMRGAPASGKGTVLSVIQALVGNAQTATPRFGELAGPHALSPLLGKLVCLIDDARPTAGAHTNQCLEVLLSIVGRGRLSINPKFKQQIEGTMLTCRITIASNTFLSIPDTTGALQRRLLLLEFQRSFASNPDIHLKDKLATETAGIALWALKGLRRLRTTNKFTIPQSSMEAMEEWKSFNNPLSSFLDECTTIEPEGSVSRAMLYDAWMGWSEAHRQPVSSKSQFYNDMMFLATYATTCAVEDRGRNEIVYKGLTLRPDAARRFLGRP